MKPRDRDLWRESSPSTGWRQIQRIMHAKGGVNHR